MNKIDSKYTVKIKLCTYYYAHVIRDISLILFLNLLEQLTCTECFIPFKTIFTHTLKRSDRIVTRCIVMARIYVVITFIPIFNRLQ